MTPEQRASAMRALNHSTRLFPILRPMPTRAAAIHMLDEIANRPRQEQEERLHGALLAVAALAQAEAEAMEEFER